MSEPPQSVTADMTESMSRDSAPRMPPDPEQAFIEILQTRSDQKGASTAVLRDRGFVVLVEGTKSLRNLQERCLQEIYNDCLTLRYQIATSPIFGTLLSAVVSDLRLICDPQSQQPATKKDRKSVV